MRRATLFLALACGLSAQQIGRSENSHLRVGALAPAVTTVREPYPSVPGWWQRHLGDTAIHAGATTADIISSRGLIELNPLLRDSRGHLGARGISIKLGIFAAIELAKWRIARRHPRDQWPRAFSWAPAALYVGVAAHNWRIR